MKLTAIPFGKALLFSTGIALSAHAIAAEQKTGSGSVQRLPTVISIAGSLLEEQAVDETGRPE